MDNKMNHKIISAPASKSGSLRALICALLDDSDSILKIKNISLCADVMSGIKLIEDYRNVTCQIQDSDLFIFPKQMAENKKIPTTIEVGESGFLARVFSILGSHFVEKFRITGQKTLLNRNLHICEFVHELGLSANQNTFPIMITGKVTSRKICISAKYSSQFISGLLFLLPLLPQTSRLMIKDTVSYPYIDLTLKYMTNAGIKVERENYNIFHLSGKQKYRVPQQFVESDWSSLSYLIAVGLLFCDLEIININDGENLPDRIILQLIKSMGGICYFENDHTLIVKKSKLKGFHFDLINNPDLAPVLVALAISASSTSRLFNCNRLRNKESDRLMAIITLLNELNVKNELNGDTLTIFPGTLTGGLVRTFSDHRIAMTGVILNTISQNEVIIDDYECINKSYPGFITDMTSIGVV